MYNIRSQINTIGYHSIKFSFLSPSEYILNMIVWKKKLVEICWIFANFPIFPWFCLFFCLFLLEFWQKRQSEGKFNKNGLNSVEKISQTIMFKIFRSKQSFTRLAQFSNFKGLYLKNRSRYSPNILEERMKFHSGPFHVCKAA